MKMKHLIAIIPGKSLVESSLRTMLICSKDQKKKCCKKYKKGKACKKCPKHG